MHEHFLEGEYLTSLSVFMGTSHMPGWESEGQGFTEQEWGILTTGTKYNHEQDLEVDTSFKYVMIIILVYFSNLLM